MKERISKIVRHLSFRSCHRPLVVALVALSLLRPTVGAAGVGDILSILRTITSTLQNVIGGVLMRMEALHSTINTFRQQVIWPLAEIHQAKRMVGSIRVQYGPWMSQVHAMRNNSATLANPAQLEAAFRSGQAPAIAELGRLYTAVYTAVPPATDTKPVQRNLMDMDDALAMASLKTTVISDQTTRAILALADSLEQQSAGAAPGSGPMLVAQAQVANLENEAYLAELLAADLRQQAAKLAHENTLRKQSAASTRNLQNQMQQVLTHP
jgi:hypothetical protein